MIVYKCNDFVGLTK